MREPTPWANAKLGRLAGPSMENAAAPDAFSRAHAAVYASSEVAFGSATTASMTETSTLCSSALTALEPSPSEAALHAAAWEAGIEPESATSRERNVKAEAWTSMAAAAQGA